MSLLWRILTCRSAGIWASKAHQRTLSTTSAVHIKKIVCEESGDTVTIEGQIVASPRQGLVVRNHGGGCTCSLCHLNLNLKHTDVLILSQFLRSDGCMMPRRVTGVCRLQQRRLQQLVAMAQKSGLMPNLAPASSKCDPKKRHGFRKFNKYFDEATIVDVKPFGHKSTWSHGIAIAQRS